MQQTPKHEMVYEYLRTYIDQNKFSSDTSLPSEPFLTRKFHVCRETVRKAMGRLEAESLVVRKRGSGTRFDRQVALDNAVEGKGFRARVALIIQGQDRSANKLLIKAVKDTSADIEFKVFFTDNKIANERRCLESCRHGFDGIIIDGVKASILNPNLDVYASLYARGIPFIFYNNFYAGTSYPKIIMDDIGCADALVHELTQARHRYIAGLFLYDNYQGVAKYQGYAKAILKYKAHFDDQFVKFLISDNIGVQGKFEREVWTFLRTIPKCTAIVCCNIMIYKVVRSVLHAHGKSIPEDYSVVCFDYSDVDYLQEDITCSIHPSQRMGTLVGEQIIQMMDDPDYKNKTYSQVLQPQIHIGHSVRSL